LKLNSFMRFEFSGGAWRAGKVPAAVRYLLAVVLFSVALGARFMLIDLLPARGFPFLSFFPAVLLAAYVVGIGPGLLVAVLSIFSAWAFFMGPRVTLFAMPQSDAIALVFFTVILIVDCAVIERMNLTMRRLHATTLKLQNSEDALVLRHPCPATSILTSPPKCHQLPQRKFFCFLLCIYCAYLERRMGSL